MDVVGRYSAIIAAVILVILFPIQYIASSETENADSKVCLLGTELSEMSLSCGSITSKMYEELTKGLAITGDLYEVSIEVAHPITRNNDEGEALLQYDVTYTDEIIKNLHMNNYYKMNKGDLISFTIIRRNRSIRSSLEGVFIVGRYSVEGKRYVFGGEVRTDGGN